MKTKYNFIKKITFPTRNKKNTKKKILTFSQIFSVYTSFTLTVAVYSTLELFKFKSNEYASLLKQISLARDATSSEPVEGDNDVFDEIPVLDDQYSDIEPEAQPTRETGTPNDHAMRAMMDSMKAMSDELAILKQGSVSSNAGVDVGIDNYEHERQGCNIRMADRGEFTNLPLLSFPGSGNTWTRYSLLIHSFKVDFELAPCVSHFIPSLMLQLE